MQEGGWSPSNIKVSACAWAHQVGIYTAKRALHPRSVHSPYGETGEVKMHFPSSRIPKPAKEGKCPAKSCC